MVQQRFRQSDYEACSGQRPTVPVGRAAVERYYNWDRVVADLIAIDQEFRAR